MSAKYRLSLQVDQDRMTVIARVVGPMPSRILTEQFLDAYSRIPDIWRYNRVIDYRKFTGSIDFADVEDFIRRWEAMVGHHQPCAKVAFVTDDPLEHARSNIYDSLMPDQILTFATVDEALDWVSDSRA
ncbi:MAG: hypothetical protein JF615_09225 [Asticcacaulis sp.]|nr:hypothetical protein [Asticcacaulis sp.]